MKDSTPPYFSYLVRFWFVNAPTGPTWRVSVQQVGQDRLRHFPDLERYFEFVVQEMNTQQPDKDQV